jgi:hypothetical protein
MKTQDDTDTPPESDIIRADIEQTRQTMDQTLDELGTKMKPHHLIDEMLGFLHLDQLDGQKLKEKAGAAAQSVGQAANRACRAMTDVVREHPIPTLLIGAGLAWAFYESHQRSHNGNGHPHEDAHARGELEGEWEAHGLRAKAQHGLESAKEGIQTATQEVTDQVATTARAISHKAAQMKDQVIGGVQRGYQAGREKFVQTSQAHPLQVGLGFLAAGVLLGLALPASRKEDEWVGEAADRVKDRAKATGQDLLNRGKTVATAAAEAVKKTAAEQGLTPQALKEKVQQVASETQEAAKRSAEQQGLKPLPA